MADLPVGLDTAGVLRVDPGSIARRVRAAAVITLVWAGFMGLAASLFMLASFMPRGAALFPELWHFLPRVFMRFAIIGAILGAGFTLVLASSTSFRPARRLSERRAGAIGFVTSAVLGMAALSAFHAQFGPGGMLAAGGVTGVIGGLLGRTLAYTAREP